MSRWHDWQSHQPPWWPEGEPWPPARPPHWRAARLARGRFFRRFGLFLIFVIVLIVTSSTALVWLISSALGVVNVPPQTLEVIRALTLPVALLIVVGFLSLGRLFRRAALPVGDLLEAAGRIAEGDTTVRIPERGSRETRLLASAFNAMAAGLEANQERRRGLLADVTHELRTPITVIQGNLEGILDGVYPADAEHLEPILDETRLLSRVIDDLRTLSLAESGALKLEREPADLGDLMQDVAQALRPAAERAGVALQVDAPLELPDVNMDPARIREVITNLTTNALRYTPAGGAIDLRAWVEGARLYGQVADNGAGIAPEVLEHLFDRFTKSSDSRGTGLGLAISKSLIAAHGGEIHVESELGKGTQITWWVKIEDPAA